LQAAWLDFPSPAGHGTGRGYLARPAGPSAALPVVLVIHENRGLNPHIQDIARRLALEGFIAFAPDALFPVGGYPGDEDLARSAFAGLDQGKVREDMLAAARFAQTIEGGNGHLGAIGFCFGGGIANFLATRLPELREKPGDVVRMHAEVPRDLLAAQRAVQVLHHEITCRLP
jgi:carboxymethylenebutenolidase